MLNFSNITHSGGILVPGGMADEPAFNIDGTAMMGSVGMHGNPST